MARAATSLSVSACVWACGGNNIQFTMGTHINGNGNVNNTSNKGTLMNHNVDTN